MNEIKNTSLDRYCVVLVATSDPGNIGATARAMFTMGMTDLRLVKPQFFPHQKAIWRATAAAHVVENAKIFDNIEQAIEDCVLAVAVSARSRSLSWPICSCRQLATHIEACIKQNNSALSTTTALVFGRESSGLTNDELQLCHVHCVIPANPHYPVLNLSHAVQIICYELFCVDHQPTNKLTYQSDQSPATLKEMQYMLKAVFAMIEASGFSERAPNSHLFMRIRRLFMRQRLDKMEVNILHGIAKHVHRIITHSQTHQDIS